MTGDRRPIFELHIRPMFRLLDQVHMLRLPLGRRMDLMDFQQVRDGHLEVIDFLKAGSPMPPTSVGGPWPREWIDLFIRWTQTGFGRLASASGSNFQLVSTAPDRYALSCDVALPDSSAVAWFDIVQARPEAQVYEVVVEQINGAASSSTTITIEERIRGPLSVSEVIVLDATGEHRVPLPSA